MLMKKWMIFFLCLICILTGCAGEIWETKPTASGEFDFNTSDFSCYANISSDCVWDLCPFMDTQLDYMLLTKEPLNSEETVMLMFTNVCEYTGVECSEEWMTEFPFWLYQTYRGVDWNLVADVAAAAQNGDADAKRKLSEYETLYLEDYEALNFADISPLYGYWMVNCFAPLVLECSVDDAVLRSLKQFPDTLTLEDGTKVTMEYIAIAKNNDGTTVVRFSLEREGDAYGTTVEDMALYLGTAYPQVLVLPVDCVYQKTSGDDAPWYVRQVTEDGFLIGEKQVVLSYSNGNMAVVSGIEEGQWFDSGYKVSMSGDNK